MENNKTTTKPDINSKFLVQKQAFLRTIKLILCVHKSGITFEPLPKNNELQENILFSDIGVIEAPSHNNDQIIIKTKKNTVLTLQCNERVKCICEIYSAWDHHIITVSPQLERAFPSYELAKQILPNNRDVYINTQVTIFRAHLEIDHKALKSSESWTHIYTQIEQNQSGFTPTIILPYCFIKTIYKTDTGIIIEMNNSQLKHHLLFYDLEKANNLISKIEINCQEYMENLIHFEVLDANDSQLYPRVRSLNTILFECRVHKLLESGHLLEIKLAVVEDSIVEIDPTSNLVMQKYDIRHVENIIQMASGVPALCITFHDEAVITYIPEDYERDLVVSNIFTLVNWRRINQDSSLKRNDFIHCGIPNKSLKINGWIQETVELQYEKDLIASLLTTKNEEELLRILQDFSQNAHFKHSNINDPKPLQMLIRVFIKNAKLLKTKQFLKYWDSLQSDLAAIYKPTPRKRSIIVEKQERFKSFGNYDADEDFSIQLNIKPFLTVLNKTEEALKSIIILLSSKPFFQELSSNKKEVATYESFLQEVISLIQTPYPTLQHLAGNFLRSFCLFCAPNENKIESMNRRFILTQKIGLLQTLSFNLAQNVLTKSAKKSHGVDSLPMHAILASLRTIKTFLSDRPDNTELGDFQLIQRLVSCSYYFSIFNFLMRSNCIACVYNTTILLTSCFKNCSSRQLYKRIQNRFLKNSSLIPFNITLVFSSPLIPQRKLSMKLLYYAFHENEEACSIAVQIFPKYLFKRVYVGNEYITKWTLPHWEDFFSNLVDNFDTPIEQWNEECRRELLKYLKDVDREVTHMLEHCPASKLHELIDPTFHNDGDFLLNIRWNYEELQVEYQNLEKKIKVGKYFLSSLLQDGEAPTLAMDIRNPSKLWNELHMKFVNEISQPPLKVILKTQILLYRLYSSNIKEANTISFWLKYLNRKEFVELRYLVLQLLYTFVTVENAQTATANILKFVELEGLKILADVLIGLYFNEDHNKHTTGVQFVEPNNNTFEYNYTNLHLPKQGYTLSQKKSNSIYLILKIFKAVLNKTVVTSVENDQEIIVYPISRTKSKLAEPKVLNGLVNILLLQDDFLTLEVLDLLSAYFLDKQIYKELINETPIFDFLLVNLNLNTALSRFSLLLKIYHRVADHLPFDDNPIKAYTDFSFVTAPEEVAARAISHFPPLRYLPKQFMWILINISVTDFVRTFFSSLYEAPELIWTSEMRNHLITLINEQTHAYKERIVAYTEFDDVHIVKDLPEYFPKHTTPAIQNAFLYTTPDEVMCGPIILRIWVQKIWKTFEMPKKEIPLFVQNLYILLENAMQVSLQNMTPRQISDLVIILQAHAKAIKIYSIIEYKCFDHVLTVLDFSAKKLSTTTASEETDLVQIYSLLILAEKIIYRSICSKGSENIKSLIAENGVPLILSIYNSLSDDNSKITRISYSQLKLASLSTRIVNQVVVTSFETITNSIDLDAKLQLFLNLQSLLKISALCFESIRAQYSEKNLDSSQECDDIEDNTHKDNAVSVNSIKNSIFDILARASSRSLQYNFYIEKLLHTTKHLIDLSLNLSVHVETAVLYIQSGLAWRLFELDTYFDDPNRYSKKIEDQHYRTTVKFVENSCIALRNILIFAHEAYELKMNSSSSSANETSPSELIVKRQPVSEELAASLDKINGFEKTVLSKFYLVVLKLIGKELTKSILLNYFEPTAAPHEEDRDPVLRFMKVFATSFFDPQTLWNNETRQEFTELIQDQILSIQQSHGKIFVNKVEPFEYQCYKKELIIDEIFISYFNKTPEWKVANFKQFLLKILQVITELWQEIVTAPALETLIKLNTAVTAIANIIKYHECLEPLLFEENITILGTLLLNTAAADLDQQESLSLKFTVLSIICELSKSLDGATKVIENVKVMRNFVHILTQNSQKSSDLIKKVIEIIKTVIPFDDIKTTVIEYGLIVTLLEASLKSEIHSNWIRTEGFHFVIQIARENKRFLEQIGDNLFTPSIYRLIKDNTVTSEEILNILENGCEKPETFWTKQMRLEVLLALKNTSDEITNVWDQQVNQDVRVVENPSSFTFNLTNKLKPVFPELKNNILIQNKFLQNLNKNPKFGENDNLMDLMNKLVEYAQSVYDILYKKKASPHKNEHMTSPTNQGSKNNSNRLFCELITVLTSLMFVLDYHIYGPKKVMNDRPASVIEEANEEDEEDGASNFTQEEPYQPKFDLCVDENLLSFLSECVNLLSHSFFVAGTAGTQLTVTLLQVFYLLADDEKGIAFLKEVDMIQILAGILRKIVQPTKFQASFTFVEEELILSLLLKIIQKDKTLVPHVIEECIDSLRELLHLQKTHLRELLENIVTVIAQNPDHGREAFLEINKKENLISVSTIHDCQPNTLLNKFWKSPSHGWIPYHAKNTLNTLLKQPKEIKLHGPIITETSIENLPDRNGEMKATQELIQNYLSKITQEHSQSYI